MDGLTAILVERLQTASLLRRLREFSGIPDDLDQSGETDEVGVKNDVATQTEPGDVTPIPQTEFSGEQNTTGYSDVECNQNEAAPDEEKPTEDDILALRHRQYISFISQEDPEDYTEGPSRIVEAFDGVKGCPALILTYDLSLKIRNAVQNQRILQKEDIGAAAKLKAISKFKSTLNHEVKNHRTRIAAEEAKTPQSKQAVEVLQEELEMLQLLKDGTVAEENTVELNRNKRAKAFQRCVAEVHEYLEEAFIAAQLLEHKEDEAQPEIQEYDLQEEYQKLCEQMHDIDTKGMGYQPLDTSPSHVRANVATPTPEDQARLEASEKLWNAKEQLQEARCQFDGREEERQQELVFNKQAATNGQPTTDESIEAFDLRWILRYQKYTRDLAQAEKAYKSAKAAAVVFGSGEMGDDQTSCFADDAEDGTFLSQDYDSPEEVAANPRVSNWLTSILSEATSESEAPADVDEWHVEEVDLCDSRSLVAYGTERRKIDQWQRVCQNEDD